MKLRQLFFPFCVALVRLDAMAQTLEVTSTGVGVGTTSPAAPLHVIGTNLLARFESNAASSLVYFTPSPLWGFDEYRIGAGVVNVNDWGVQNMTRSTTPLVITGGSTGGRVGIGISNPGGGLHIKSDFIASYMQLAIQSGPADSRSGITFWDAAGSARMASFYASSDGNSYLSATEYSAGVFHIFSAGAERMTFLANGNVGIGTSSPGYKLEVSGSVRATSFVANANTYADFVFRPGYQLPSLSEVEAAIKRDGRLPDIPSEEEAKAQGVDLARMQVKLLQKVEELTLYLLAHDKTLQTQQRELQELRIENAAMRRQLPVRGTASPR